MVQRYGTKRYTYNMAFVYRINRKENRKDIAGMYQYLNDFS
jgi:hypothetical protein